MVKNTPWIVAIGASGAEGLTDIKRLLSALPSPTSAVVLVVLHRSWERPSALREVLACAIQHPVVIAVDGERLEAGTVYIGEPAEHLTLAAKTFGDLVADPDRLYRNRTVDLLFRSLAKHGGTRCIGVVLSGSLDDGSRGVAAIHEAGGLTMVTTPARLQRHGMPENAISYDGPVDLVAEPEQIASAIAEATQR